MPSSLTKVDISSEFFVVPWRKGIKLMPPTATKESLFIDVKTLLQTNMNVYFLAQDSTLLEANEESWGSCGFHSRKDALGRTAAATTTKETAKECILHDRMVLNSASLIIKEHLVIRRDDIKWKCVCLKMPFYSSDEVVGIFGFSILVNRHSIGDCLIQLVNSGILSAPTQTQISMVGGKFKPFLPEVKI